MALNNISSSFLGAMTTGFAVERAAPRPAATPPTTAEEHVHVDHDAVQLSLAPLEPAAPAAVAEAPAKAAEAPPALGAGYVMAAGTGTIAQLTATPDAGAAGNLKVKARGTIGDSVFEDTNQMARVGGRADKPTLICERVATRETKSRKALPNGNMATAHAEIGVIQQAYEAGKTAGADMKLLVEGKAVCGHCLGDIPAAAEKAGLKSLTVYEQATGKTLRWEPGMRTLKAAE